MPRVLIRLVCQHLRHVILKVTFFWMSSECGGRDKPTKQLHRLLSSMLHKLLYFSNEQEQVPLQMLGPVNGVSNYLALEKIYCMLILWIRVFWPPELQGHKTIISQRGGIMGTLGSPPQLIPVEVANSKSNKNFHLHLVTYRKTCSTLYPVKFLLRECI